MSAGNPVYAIHPFFFRRRGKVISGDEANKENKRTARKAKGSTYAEKPAEAWRTKHFNKKKFTIEIRRLFRPLVWNLELYLQRVLVLSLMLPGRRFQTSLHLHEYQMWRAGRQVQIRHTSRRTTQHSPCCRNGLK